MLSFPALPLFVCTIGICTPDHRILPHTPPICIHVYHRECRLLPLQLLLLQHVVMTRHLPLKPPYSPDNSPFNRDSQWTRKIHPPLYWMLYAVVIIIPHS